MNSMTSRPKKSPSSKASKAGRVTPCAPSSRSRGAVRRGLTRPASPRVAFRAWRASLPTPLERDTLLMPDAIAETVVTEASRYLDAELPGDLAERLAAKAHYLYRRHAHFHKMLVRPGNRGRDNLYMYMRHWTAGWLKRERYALFKRLPWDYALGRSLRCSQKAQSTSTCRSRERV
jgi:hypothetical protein